MNIHQIQNEGRSQKLGPVEVKKVYPMKPGAKNAFMLIEDSSGKTALKIWGLSPSQMPAEGSSITLIGNGSQKSGITNQEYPEGSGKFSLNASECSFSEGVGQGEPEQPSSNVVPQNTMTTNSSDKLAQVMKRAALANHMYVEELILHGYTKDEAIMMSQGAGNTFPLWWFGEKGLS